MSNGFKLTLLLLVAVTIGVGAFFMKVNSPNVEISAEDQAKVDQQLKPILKKH